MSKQFSKKQFQSVVSILRNQAEDKRSDQAQMSDDRNYDAYSLSGQDIVQEWDPKLHTLMLNVGKARKEMHDYVLAQGDAKVG